VLPPAVTVAAALMAPRDPRFCAAGAASMSAWLLMAALYRPAQSYFGLSGLRALLLPLAGTLYGLMTLDSALRGGRKDWR